MRNSWLSLVMVTVCTGAGACGATGSRATPARPAAQPPDSAPLGGAATDVPAATTESAATPATTPAAPPAAEPPATLFNQHADLTAEMDTSRVADLQVAFRIETGDPVSHAPLIDDGRVYFADWSGRVWVADAATGEVHWSRQIEQPKREWPWHGFAGTGAMSADTLFEASVEGTVFAIDKQTGDVKWKTSFAEDPQAGNVGRLLYWDGLLYLPVSSVEEPLTAKMKGFEPDFRGNVVALDAETGKVAWRTYLVEAPHNGVAAWSGFAVDPQRSLLFFTTGNNYTGEATDLADAVIAADAKTGEIKWSYQATQNDIWTKASPKGPDYDFGAAPQLFDAVIDGQPRNLIGAGQKNGVFHVLDRTSGLPVWSTVVGYGHIGGGIHAEASIGDDRVLVWANNAYPYGKPMQHPMDVKAVDIASGEYLWVNPKAQPALLISAGFLAGDVYFVASLDGKIRAYAAQDGTLLWTSPDVAPVASSLWVEQGRLYAGVGAPAQWGGRDGTGALVAFAP